jgi:DNA-binding LytR/AlgR family response regulator
VPRVFLHLADRRRRVIDPHAIYYLEADGDDTIVRLRSRRTLRDVRPLAELEPLFSRPGFFRVHQSFLVNLDRVYEIRPRSTGSRDWELSMEPPVNRVIPISRERLRELWRRYEVDHGP